MRLWLTIIILLIASVTQAQQFTGGFTNFGSNHANGIFTDTRKFNHGVLGASDFTVQRSLQTLDQKLGASGTTLITACQTTEDFCFQYTDQVLVLWVNQVKQAQWPIVAVFDNLLLEDGFAMLQEDGTSKIRLE